VSSAALMGGSVGEATEGAGRDCIAVEGILA
jgi:hypothetical protein